jgi:hypothetical protein
MKLGLNERQLKLILSQLPENQEISEQPTDPSAAQPSAGTSATQTGAQGYPEVEKWESGVTRGPANQVGITKWSDVVGASLKRDKANPLNEQEGRGSSIALNPEEDKKKEDFRKKYIVYPIPKSSIAKTETLTLPREVDGQKTMVSLWKTIPNSNTFGFSKWNNDPEWSVLIPTQDNIENIFYKTDLLRSFTVGGIKYNTTLKRTSDKPVVWSFLWFEDKNGNYYDQSKFIEIGDIPDDFLKKENTWWDKWGQWTLAGASVIAACFGPVGLLVSIGLDLVAAADLYFREDDTIGASVSVVLAFLPLIGDALRVGKVTTMKATELAKEFAPLKTESEILNKINEIKKTRPNDAYLITRLLEENPEKIGKMIENSIFNHASKIKLTKEQVVKVVDNLNDLIKQGKLSSSKASSWVKRLGVQRFGFDMGATGYVMYLGAKEKERQTDNKVSFKGKGERLKTHDEVKKLFDDENN